jgi:hypothetical protein
VRVWVVRGPWRPLLAAGRLLAVWLAGLPCCLGRRVTPLSPLAARCSIPACRATTTTPTSRVVSPLRQVSSMPGLVLPQPLSTCRRCSCRSCCTRRCACGTAGRTAAAVQRGRQNPQSLTAVAPYPPPPASTPVTERWGLADGRDDVEFGKCSHRAASAAPHQSHRQQGNEEEAASAAAAATRLAVSWNTPLWVSRVVQKVLALRRRLRVGGGTGADTHGPEGCSQRRDGASSSSSSSSSSLRHHKQHDHGVVHELAGLLSYVRRLSVVYAAVFHWRCPFQRLL